MKFSTRFVLPVKSGAYQYKKNLWSGMAKCKHTRVYDLLWPSSARSSSVITLCTASLFFFPLFSFFFIPMFLVPDRAPFSWDQDSSVPHIAIPVSVNRDYFIRVMVNDDRMTGDRVPVIIAHQRRNDETSIIIPRGWVIPVSQSQPCNITYGILTSNCTCYIYLQYSKVNRELRLQKFLIHVLEEKLV